LLHTGEEVRGGRAGHKEAVGILPRRQDNNAGLKADAFEAPGEEARSSLASLVSIIVKGDVDRAAGLPPAEFEQNGGSIQ
jgi:hypothetical protein